MTDPYRENHIESLRAELQNLVAEKLTPLALKYGYSDTSLESHIKWRPLVLLLGNYSSGKSTLVNDLLGVDLQNTGQAPTDDSFTVITGCDPGGRPETRDGKVLLGDPQYPFESLKRHGSRFASHFQLKKLDVPLLKQIALVDTPGMLDSISERDRGYDYQEVIGDLAGMADLILVLFDPHKAGTVRESHFSLRQTLPAATFEDRVVFVLNRIDECGNLEDMLRVYGTLCWNLSQMTGRKDIPRILLSWSQKASNGPIPEHLNLMGNQRRELEKAIYAAPKHRLDNLASFIETHSRKLSMLVEALLAWQSDRRAFNLKATFLGMFPAMLIAVGVGRGQPIALPSESHHWWLGLVAALVFMLCWIFGSQLWLRRRKVSFKRLLTLDTVTKKETWASLEEVVKQWIAENGDRVSRRTLKQERAQLKKVVDHRGTEIRQAIDEIRNE